MLYFLSGKYVNCQKSVRWLCFCSNALCSPDKHVQVEADFIKTWTLHCEYSNCAVYFNTCQDWSIQGDFFFLQHYKLLGNVFWCLIEQNNSILFLYIYRDPVHSSSSVLQCL